MKDRESGVAKRKRNLTSQPNLVLCRAPLCWPRCWVRQIPQTALRRNGCGSLPICMLAFLSQAATWLRPIETTHMMLCTSRAETPWTPHDSIRQTLVLAGVEREIGTSAQPKSPSCIRSTWSGSASQGARSMNACPALKGSWPATLSRNHMWPTGNL